MEPLTSPLSPKLQIFSEKFLLAVYSSCVILPLSYSLFKYSLEVDVELLSPLFFSLLFKATLFAFFQATATLFSLALGILLISNLQLFAPARAISRKAFEVVGILSFSMSPTLVALALTMSFGVVFQKLPSGFGIIVFCHFLMNFAFSSSLFLRRMDRFLSRQGKELFLFLQSLGSSRKECFMQLIWPIFKTDIKSWGPQVFLWCFMSFAPVILLADGPHQNTPDVLLYYSLLNDPSGSRMLVIFLLTATLSFFLNRRFFKQPLLLQRAHHEESQTYRKEYGKSRGSSFVLVGLSAFLFFPFLYSLFSPFFTKSAFSLSEISFAIFPTLLIFFLSFFLSLVFSVLTILCGKEVKTISYCNFISSPMMLVGTFSLIAEVEGTLSYILISFGAFLAVFPWLHHQLRSICDRLPDELKLLSLSLGMNNFSYFKNFLWPQLKPGIYHFSILISLWSLGEYTFSKALLARNSTLALFIEEKLRRYQFAEASLALSLILAMSVIVVTPLLWKGRKRAAF